MRGWLLVAGVVTAAAAGCGGGDQRAARPTPTPAPDAVKEALDVAAAGPPDVAGDDETKVTRLLRKRAALLEDGRGRALAATARGAQRARDRRAARRVGAIGVRDVRFEAQDLATARTATVKGALSYRIRGLERPFHTARRVKARKTGRGWRVVSDRPRSERVPWEVDAFRRVRTRHVVLLAARGVATGELRPGLERAPTAASAATCRGASSRAACSCWRRATSGRRSASWAASPTA